MKTRNGFVSNSSSSSFVCQVCGEIETGYDSSLQDFDMSTCVHGHQFHNSHTEKDFYDADAKTKYEYLKENISNNIESFKKRIQRYKEENKPEQVERCEKTLSQYEDELEQLSEDFANMDENEFMDKYEDNLIDTVCDIGVPEDFCPVCALLKQAKADKDYEEYKRLQEKFSYLAHI